MCVRACVYVCVRACASLKVLKNCPMRGCYYSVCHCRILPKASSFYTSRSNVRFLRMTVLRVVRVTRRSQQLTLAAYKTRTRMIPSFSNVLDNFSLCIQSVSSLCCHYTRFITNAILCNDFCLRHLQLMV